MARYATSVSVSWPETMQRARGGRVWSSERMGMGVAVMLLGVAVSLLGWFFLSDTFYVQRESVSIEGNRLLTVEAIYAASGLDGLSVFWVDGREVAERLRDAFPGLNGVEVVCALPNRVWIQVEEGGVGLVWQRVDGAYWVDGAGHLTPLKEAVVEAVVVQDVREDPSGVAAGVPVEVVRAALALAEAMSEVKGMLYRPEVGLYVQHPRGVEVWFGTDAAGMARRVALWRALEERWEREGRWPALVDLRFLEAPYLRW